MQNLKLNISKLLSFKEKFILTSLTGVIVLSGCGTVDCNINDTHAHKYTNDNGYVMYSSKEKKTYKGYNRSDEYILLNEDEEKLLNYENKNGLIRISDNTDIIIDNMKKNTDYIEYRYSYVYLIPIPHHMRVGKTSTTYFTYIPATGHSWTSDASHSNLTGEQRLCHYVYYGYKIEKNEKGKYYIVESDCVDNILDISSEYPYIKSKYYKVVNAKYGNDLDYEDGPENDKKLIEDNKDNSTSKEKSLKKTNN